jgi:hypothetical protein
MKVEIEAPEYAEIIVRLAHIEAKLDDRDKTQIRWQAWYSADTYAAVMGGEKKFYQNHPQYCPPKYRGPNNRLIFRGEDVARYTTMTPEQMEAEYRERVKAFKEKHGLRAVR